MVPPGTKDNGKGKDKDKTADTAAPPPLPAVPAPPSLPSPAPSPPKEVIVDSTPTGAKIVRDGVVTAETPEALELTAVTTVVLRKDGWADKTVTLDPATTRKIVVKLERPKLAKATPSKPATTPSATKPPAVAPAKPKPGEPVDPYAATAKPAAPPKPAAPTAPPPKPHDELSSRVEKAGAAAGHRVGALYHGAAAEEGGRSDWFVQLEGGHCYTFVGEGGDGVAKLYLYLWGPRGRRLQSTREDTAHARMTYCTAFPGSYHFQAKVDDGHGEYRVGIYTH